MNVKLNNAVERLLIFVAWTCELCITLYFWQCDDAEIVIAMTPFTVTVVLSLFLLYLTGILLTLKYLKNELTSTTARIKQRCAFLLALIAFCGLAFFFYYLLIGLLLALLLITAAQIWPNWLAWGLALLLPLLAGITDIWLKGISFHLEGKVLFMLFNSLVLLYSYKVQSERQQKLHSQYLYRELQATQSLLSSAAKRDERLRISRDLHDSLGHKLTALKLQLELASHIDSSQILDKVTLAKNISESLLNDVRQSVNSFRQGGEIDLFQAISTLCRGLPNLQINRRFDLPESLLSARQAEALFRCIQESLTNTIKHAKATVCDISLYLDKDTIHATIQDNGQQCAHIQAGNGLQGMAERIQPLDGTFTYRKIPQGFLVHISFPMAVIPEQLLQGAQLIAEN